jgi:hypothetical protein
MWPIFSGASLAMADQHVALLQRIEDRLDAREIIRGTLGSTIAMARQVERHGFVAQFLQFRYDPLPAPCAVETAVNEDEAHV